MVLLGCNERGARLARGHRTVRMRAGVVFRGIALRCARGARLYRVLGESRVAACRMSRRAARKRRVRLACALRMGRIRVRSVRNGGIADERACFERRCRGGVERGGPGVRGVWRRCGASARGGAAKCVSGLRRGRELGFHGGGVRRPARCRQESAADLRFVGAQVQACGTGAPGASFCRRALRGNVGRGGPCGCERPVAGHRAGRLRAPDAARPQARGGVREHAVVHVLPRSPDELSRCVLAGRLRCLLWKTTRFRAT